MNSLAREPAALIGVWLDHRMTRLLKITMQALILNK